MINVSKALQKYLSINLLGKITRESIMDYSLLILGRNYIWYEFPLLVGLIFIRRGLPSSKAVMDILSITGVKYTTVVYRRVTNDIRSRYYVLLRVDKKYLFIKIGCSDSDKESFSKEIDFYSNSLPPIRFDLPQMLDYKRESKFVMLVYQGLSSFRVEREDRTALLPIFTQRPTLRSIREVVLEIDATYKRKSLCDDPFYEELFKNLSCELECGHIHGDLGSDNVLRSDLEGKSVVIIDWEHYVCNLPLSIDKIGAFLGDNYVEISSGRVTDYRGIEKILNLKKLELLCAIYFYEQSNFRVALSFKKYYSV